MNVVYDDTNAVLGINRPIGVGEYEIEVPHIDFIFGLDNDFYEVVDGVFTPKDPAVVNAIIAQREADVAAEINRVGEVVAAQETSGLKQYTMDQVNTYLDNRFNAMTDLDSVKTELRAIFDKMVPYLLN